MAVLAVAMAVMAIAVWGTIKRVYSGNFKYHFSLHAL